MEKQKPLATVLMPVYNAEKYLKEAMDSVLSQSFEEYEFLIVNDCSKDNSEEIILSYTDARIRYVKNQKNLGLSGALNVGIDLIETKYMIRMDADDISVPGRFEKLISFMEKNSDVGVYSSALERFEREVDIWKYPENNDDIKATFLFGSSIAHAPCILRMSVLKEHKMYFRDVHLHIEDYDLWYRLKDVTNFATTQEVLYRYRVVANSITTGHDDTLMERRKKMYRWVIESFGIVPTEEELEMHISTQYNTKTTDSVDVKAYRKWMDKIVQVNEANGYFPKEALKRQVDKRWTRFFYLLPDRGFKIVISYFYYSGNIKWNQFLYWIKYLVNKNILRKKV